MFNRLIFVFNNEVNPPGMILNAAGHMTIGMAPRFPKDKCPAIQIYSASKTEVRRFRTAAMELNKKLTDEKSVFSDFAHTTTDGTAQDHAKQTAAIEEKDITYFGACICANANELLSLNDLLQQESYQLLEISNLIKPENDHEAEFDLKPSIEYPPSPDFTDEIKKFSIVLHNQLTGADAITALIRATIKLGNNIDTHLLRLHQYPDQSGSMHPGMSEYGLVALTIKKTRRLDTLNYQLTSVPLHSCGVVNSNEILAISLFGDKKNVEELTKKDISVWKNDLFKTPQSALKVNSLFPEPELKINTGMDLRRSTTSLTRKSSDD